ncbi:MAG: hypothetical protein JWQ35_1911 [Bacteriovoracaceae bacterium]|nr:hypothetical protein [Bacteriovoracaceae bacterium]
MITLLIVLIIGSVLIKQRLDQSRANRAAVDIRYLPEPQVANVLAFGFREALADFYWIDAINYFGEQLLNKGRTYKYLKSYTELIFNLDPHFAYFYDWAATAFIYNAAPVTRENVINSISYINYGIQKFNEIYRYDRNMIVKGAFNYAIETTVVKNALAYFALAARSFRSERGMLLVASSYAHSQNLPAVAAALKLEYFGTIAFEAQSKSELTYALQVLSSSRMNVEAGEFVKALRIKMESEEDVRKIVEKRLEENPLQKKNPTSNSLPVDPRIENTLQIELSRTWMPADMLALFSL